MKKHLRGKRYIRSRASVKIGRMNHQIHKIESARKTLDEMNVPQEGRIVQWKE
jgi:hypothetical protein